MPRELLALRWDDIDLVNGVVEIRRTTFGSIASGRAWIANTEPSSTMSRAFYRAAAARNLLKISLACCPAPSN
jgi:integrase